MKRRLTILTLGLLLAAGCSGPRLEVQTFDLKGMDPGEARELIRPYVFSEREPIPGMVTISGSRLTVRETRDHLAAIADVLAQYDHEKPTYTLEVRVIEADSYPADPALDDIRDQLAKVFRFRGYRMAGRVVTTVSEYADVHNRLGSANPAYDFSGQIRQIVASDDGWRVTMTLLLEIGGLDLLQTQAVLRPGQTTLVGTSRLTTPAGMQTSRTSGDSGAIILALRLEPTS